MSAVSRDWATPLTIGVFSVLAATGALMFFHLDAGLQKSIHEWLGWAMVAAVAAHAAANWGGLRRYFTRAGRGRIALGLGALVLAGSFFAGALGSGGTSPPVLAMRAVAGAPLASVAPLAGRPVEQLRGELAEAGIVLASSDASIGSVVGDDREKMGLAMRTVFGARPMH